VTNEAAAADWPPTLGPRLATAHLVLSPLVVADAEEMRSVLSDAELYLYTGGGPPTLAGLRTRYRLLSRGRSADGAQIWCNWISRTRQCIAVGTLQATIQCHERRAELAWVTGRVYWGHGYATEGATAVVEWLVAAGAEEIGAHIHPDNHASGAVARRLGLTPTAVVDKEGERLWTRGAHPSRDEPGIAGPRLGEWTAP
jgi:RimJ/RimL family protein N-acetyltransferase